MNEIQLKLCDIQGRLFEVSVDRQLGSASFIKIFMNSETAKALDSTYNRMQWAGEEYLLEEVIEAAGDKLSEKGEVYSKDVIYWIGYIYRYWHYYTEESSKAIYKQAPVETMAVVIGSEGQGVRPEILYEAQEKLIIPMQQRCESLNAAIAASIVMWQMGK